MVGERMWERREGVKGCYEVICIVEDNKKFGNDGFYFEHMDTCKVPESQIKSCCQMK